MRLRPLESRDFRHVKEWLEDESLLSLLIVEPPRLDMWFYTYIIELDDGTPVGWVDIFNVDEINRNAEVGMAIPNGRGRGLSVRVMRRIARIAFNELGLRRLTCRILSTNKTALALAPKAGFKREGVQRQACYQDGRFVDVVIFGMLAEEWE